MRRRCPSPTPDDRASDAPMLGVLSVLLLLIPSLLLMAQVTRYAQIHVGTPRFSATGPEPRVISCGRPSPLQIAIGHDGFHVRYEGQAWRRIGAPTADYDHQALAAAVRTHKRMFPFETVAEVSAQADVPFQTLVATLDTVRGPECDLEALRAGEGEPEGCLLWHPIIRDRSEDHDVPAFRGGGTWPPQPRRHATARHERPDLDTAWRP